MVFRVEKLTNLYQTYALDSYLSSNNQLESNENRFKQFYERAQHLFNSSSTSNSLSSNKSTKSDELPIHVNQDDVYWERRRKNNGRRFVPVELVEWNDRVEKEMLLGKDEMEKAALHVTNASLGSTAGLHLAGAGGRAG